MSERDGETQKERAPMARRKSGRFDHAYFLELIVAGELLSVLSNARRKFVKSGLSGDIISL
jgi:hypothetical protein